MKQLILLLFIPFLLNSQDNLKGKIFEWNTAKKQTPLAGASVYWINTEIGTVTDIDGNFIIPYKKEYEKLVISYVGFKTDTLTISSTKPLYHVLKSTQSLNEVTLNVRKKSSATSYFEARNIVNVSSDELLKAACCNLSESFETNPSIDVNFSDALTGTRQIKMLGLTSPYILIATENIPSIRGASQAYGLTFIPGTWIESIQITKGAGSVVNGFESIAGQINAELKKPNADNKLFVNAYGSLNGRLELNTHINTKVSNKWSTGVYLHGNIRNEKFDNNNDTFLDMPLAKQINFLNRWQYTDTENGLVSFINFKYLNDQKQTGQVNFNPKTDKFSMANWGSEIDTRRWEFSGKLGYVNPELPWQSLGVQIAYSNHDQDSYFGPNIYNITHESLYSNLVYNSIISDSRHKIKTGISYTNDKYNEDVNNEIYSRNEYSIGGFFEYNFDNLEALNLTAGVRVDYHNLLGTFVTPRLHVKYTTWEKSALRASVGKGIRSANIFAENQNIFATSRNINIVSGGGNIYGLDPEIAWNYGMSYLQGFNLFNKVAEFTIDFYRTNFKNQVVVDYENPTQISFYNLEGDSYANSFQAEFSYNLLRNVDVKMAYKYYEVKTQYNSGKLDRPLIPKHRVFVNISAETELKSDGSQWKFDTTFNYLGKQRFSSTQNNPVEYQLPNYSPSIATINAQITKVFSPKFEVYLGGENLTNLRQNNPIIGAENPFGPNFDTTFVYGPIFGSMYYAGLRFKIN